MGQAGSTETNTETDSGPKFTAAVPRVDIFGRLPTELQVCVLQHIVAGPDAAETIESMMDVSRRWLDVLDSVVYPDFLPGKKRWTEIRIEIDCVRTEIRRIRRRLRAEFRPGVEDLLVSAVDAFGVDFVKRAEAEDKRRRIEGSVCSTTSTESPARTHRGALALAPAPGRRSTRSFLAGRPTA